VVQRVPFGACTVYEKHRSPVPVDIMAPRRECQTIMRVSGGTKIPTRPNFGYLLS